jgi:hypothetical protein
MGAFVAARAVSESTRRDDMSQGLPPQAVQRLILVSKADLSGRYDWLPPARPGDAIVALDGLAHADLASRQPLLFDELDGWDERSADERWIVELQDAITRHPAVAALEVHGHSLINFAAHRLRSEVACLLCGWRAARAVTGARELICDPAAPPTLLMGARAGLGLDPASTPYSIPPALPGRRHRRALARQAMRALAAGSRPRDVRIAAVVAGKLSLALTSLSTADLRAVGVGAMPFPGLDHGNGALLAMKRRLPLLATYGPGRLGPTAGVRLPARLDLGQDGALETALTLLVERLLTLATPELKQAVVALAGLRRAPELRALVLPSAAYGASRLLIEWAHRRKLAVGAMQHGIYIFREYDGGDRLADVVFGWGAATAEQIQSWPSPRPRVLPVGIPGTAVSALRPPLATLSSALIATTSSPNTALEPVAFCESFIDSVTQGLRRLTSAGVALRLRPHPAEDPEIYRRLLEQRGLDVELVEGGPFAACATGADILISSASSVAFEAAALGLPVLMWLGGAPQGVRREHLVIPWTESTPGTFTDADDFGSLVDGLLERPRPVLAPADTLRSRLARFAQPFDSARFLDGLRALAA